METTPADNISARRRATEAVKRRYNRMASLYDGLLRFAEKVSLGKWRAAQWSKVESPNILEVGVGTGANFPYYPPEANVTAIDISGRMLKHARDKASRLGLKVTLQEMDVQDLRFPDNTSDSVVASLVFCTVPDPLSGLRQIERVCKAGGKVVLLEHVLSSRRPLALVMRLLNPLALWIAGDNIDRKTAESVAETGLVVEQVTHLSDLFKLVEARKRQ